MLLEELINKLYTLAEQEEIPVIKKEDFRDFLKSTRGKTISIAYRKKDGSLRLINTRTGVRKNITGGGLKYNPEEYGYIILWDLRKNGYRTVNLDTIERVKSGGQIYNIQEAVMKKPLVFKQGGQVYEGEQAWKAWKRWADFNRRDSFLYDVLKSIRQQSYFASAKQQEVLNRWFNSKR